jgi:hypothetical protein
MINILKKAFASIAAPTSFPNRLKENIIVPAKNKLGLGLELEVTVESGLGFGLGSGVMVK